MFKIQSDARGVKEMFLQMGTTTVRMDKMCASKTKRDNPYNDKEKKNNNKT